MFPGHYLLFYGLPQKLPIMKLRTGSAPCWQAICFLGFFVFFSLSTGIKAQDSASEIPRSFGMDAPFIAASTQPGWLQFPASVPSTFAHLTFEISPPPTFRTPRFC